jgi:hypothetical protein
MEGDAAYFLHRALEERTAAMKSTHPNVRKAHLELAMRYEELGDAISARDRLLGLDQLATSGRLQDRESEY